MRFTKPKIKLPKDYEERVIEKFLLFPKTLRLNETDIKEMRWLEKCKIRQFYSSGYGWLDWLWED